MAGYGLARIPYRHADKVFYAIIATLMIPAAVTFIPSFIVVSSLGWVSSLRGLIIPDAVQRVRRVLVPAVLPELPQGAGGGGPGGRCWATSGRSGGSSYRTRCRSSPRSAAITFIGNWNSFLWPLVIGQDSSSWTVQVAMSTFVTAQTINIHELFMAAAVSILPLVLVFLFLQRYLIQGVTQSGIKD